MVVVVSLIALAMVIGVYGLVAGIVKMDDAGLAMIQEQGAFKNRVGRALLWIAPKMMKFLAVVGTAAMFLVGGGIIVHGIPTLADWLHHLEAAVPAGKLLVGMLYNGVMGVIAGGLAVALLTPILKIFGKGR